MVVASQITFTRDDLKHQIKSLIQKDYERPNAIIKSLKPSFFEKIDNLLDLRRPALIAISGESASGKTTFLKVVREQVARIQERRENIILSTIKGDNYFNDISEGIKEFGSFDALIQSGYNPDAPTSFSLELLREDLGLIIKGQNIKVPRYVLDGKGVSIPRAIDINPAEVVIVEGMCSLYDDIHDIFDLKIYVDIDKDEQKQRFLNRCSERNQTQDDALKQLEIVSKSAKTFIRPTKKHADIVINGASDLESLRIFMSVFAKAFQYHSLNGVVNQ